MNDDTPKAPAAGPRAWRATRSPSARAVSPRHRKAFRLMLVIAALAGTLTGLLFYLLAFRPPLFLTIPVTQYHDQRFPVNPWVNQDSRALVGRFPGSESGFDWQEKSQLVRKLGEKAEAKTPALVVHLAAHGLARDGRVYVLPADAAPDGPSSWLPLEDVLKKVERSPARHKLLILDLMQPLADPRLGVLADDLAGRVEDVLMKDKHQGLLVLCACERDQISLASEVLGRTVFGYYLDEGLRGAADGYLPEGKRNGRVSVRELAAFVRGRVDRWARGVRGVRQTPRLFGPEGEDFELSVVTSAPAPDTPGGEPPPYLPELHEAWRLRDGWTGRAARVAPEAYRKLEDDLLRQEKRWRGGVRPDDVRRDLSLRDADQRIQKWDRDLRDAETAAAEGVPVPAEVDDRAVRLLSKHLTGLGKLKPEERANAPAAFLKELNELFDKKPPENPKAPAGEKPADKRPPAAPAAPPAGVKDNPKNRAWAIIEGAARVNPLGADQLDFLNALAPQIRLDRPSRTAAVLGQLAALQARKKFLPAGADVLRQALRVARAADSFQACDPRAFPWAKTLLGDADSLAKQGVEKLLTTRPPFAEAERLLGEAEGRYRQAENALKQAGVAQTVCDRALTRLPAYAPYLVHRPAAGETLLAIWEEAVGLTGKLLGALAQPGEGKALKELADWCENLDHLLDALDQHLGADAVKRLCEKGHSDTSPSVLAEIDAVLATPLPGAEDRKRLWKTGWDLEWTLHEKIRKADETDDAGRRVTAAPREYGPAERRQWREQERGRALRRARTSVALLELAGQDAGLRQLLQGAVDEADAGAMGTLAKALQAAWVKGLSAPDPGRPDRRGSSKPDNPSVR